MTPAPVPVAEIACPLCGAPNAVAARRCGQCDGALGEARIAQGLAPALLIVPFRCDSCEALLYAERSQRPVRCPLCDADHVAETSADLEAPVPELVIPFVIDREQASELLREWIGVGLLRPGRVVRRAARDGVTPVYVPCWMFSALARSTWRAEIAESWTRTTQPAKPLPQQATVDGNPAAHRSTAHPRPAVDVQEVEWFSLEGRHHRFHAQEIVGATAALTEAELRAMLPFDPGGARRYREEYLAGRAALGASVLSDEALPAARERILASEAESVHAFLPGDDSRNLEIVTELHRVQGTLVLVPMYVASWGHARRTWRFIMNGQTGRQSGKAPLSAMRIAALAAVLLVTLVVVLVAGGGGA